MYFVKIFFQLFTRLHKFCNLSNTSACYSDLCSAFQRWWSFWNFSLQKKSSLVHKAVKRAVLAEYNIRDGVTIPFQIQQSPSNAFINQKPSLFRFAGIEIFGISSQPMSFCSIVFKTISTAVVCFHPSPLNIFP